ncbi:hypothetical protein GCM10029992_36340 [Glycomyces albus]
MTTWQGCLQPAGPTAPPADPARSAQSPAPDVVAWRIDLKGPTSMTGKQAQQPNILPGMELGRILVRGERLSVHFHNDRAMWLCRNSDFRNTVGIIRWDFGKSPQLILDPSDERFDRPHGAEVVGMVDLAMEVWWCVVDGQPLYPLLPVAIHPDFQAFVVYWSRNSRPDVDFPGMGPGLPHRQTRGPQMYSTTEEEHVTNTESTLTDEDAAADRLRQELVEAIVKNRADIGRTVDQPILDAVRTVPRHLFTPGVSLEEAYADKVPIMKRDGKGVPISSVSAPWLQAAMLQQAQITPGMRVLEVGSGGYNAALIAELVGSSGKVVTLDIDPEVCERAERGLSDAGYEDVVTVVCGDGEFGAEQFAPFDRILVTVSTPDIPPAWVAQLGEDGRLVVPLRMRGLERSFVFEPDGDRLVCTEFELCGFVPMQGAGENRQRLVGLHGEDIALRVDDRQPVEAEPLQQALETPRHEAWSGVTVGGMEPWDDLDMWLATVAGAYGYLTATDRGVDSGLVELSLRWGMSAIWDCDSLAYLTLRPVTDDRTEFEFGVFAHGTHAAELADLLVGHIRSWDRDQRRRDGPHFEVHPKNALDGDLPTGRVIEKRHSRVTVSWPPTPVAPARRTDPQTEKHKERHGHPAARGNRARRLRTRHPAHRVRCRPRPDPLRHQRRLWGDLPERLHQLPIDPLRRYRPPRPVPAPSHPTTFLGRRGQDVPSRRGRAGAIVGTHRRETAAGTAGPPPHRPRSRRGAACVDSRHLGRRGTGRSGRSRQPCADPADRSDQHRYRRRTSPGTPGRSDAAAIPPADGHQSHTIRPVRRARTDPLHRDARSGVRHRA